MRERADRGQAGPVRPWPALAVGVGVAGVAATIGLARLLGVDWSATGQMAGITAGTVLCAGAIGMLALFTLRRRSTTARAMVVIVGSIVAVAVGAGFAASQMFLSAHDLSAIAVILSAAATTGVLVVLALGRQIGGEARSLREATRRLGEGDLRTPVPAPTSAEFAELAAELSEMARKLDEARGRERAAEASRRELIAWISHDLRTPLSAIRAVAEALEDGVVDEPGEVARYLRTLRTEADRMAGLVDDLFELSRITSGALNLEFHPVSLGDLVSDALAAASVVASSKGVRLDGAMRGDDVDLLASTPEVSRALTNVLDNAVRHTPEGGTVSVEAQVAQGVAYIAVQDGCGGIRSQDLDRVFEPAFRGEMARTPRGEGVGGAGLGLAIARGFVEAHRGDISVTNEGPGCRFLVRLPAEPVGR
jgi:signal transduction histidine kinase